MQTNDTLLFTCGALAAFALACGDDDGAAPVADAGTRDATTTADAGDSPDSGTPDEDAGDPGGCTTVTLTGEWAVQRDDDVSVAFIGMFTPTMTGSTNQLLVLFERYDPTPPVGTFELGAGDDGNYGTCRRCVAVEPLGSGPTFFADRGTLVMNENPYTRRFDATFTNLRLIEVTVNAETRESTPVPDGRCLEVVDATVNQVFPDAGWTCDAADYADGESCHCDCGGFDPDCEGCDPFMDPTCEPNPVVDCSTEEICGFDVTAGTNACLPTCDWLGRTACDTGTCVYDYGNVPADTCIDDPDRLDSAAVGGACMPSGLQRFCGIADGYAMGFCDEESVCRPICETDDDCTVSGESCRQFVIGRSLGFCGPPPPVDG